MRPTNPMSSRGAHDGADHDASRRGTCVAPERGRRRPGVALSSSTQREDVEARGVREARKTGRGVPIPTYTATHASAVTDGTSRKTHHEPVQRQELLRPACRVALTSVPLDEGDRRGLRNDGVGPRSRRNRKIDVLDAAVRRARQRIDECRRQRRTHPRTPRAARSTRAPKRVRALTPRTSASFRRPERRAAGDAEDVGLGQRIAEERLERDPRPMCQASCRRSPRAARAGDAR